MQFGAAVWPFQWHPPYDDAIRRIARLGFKQVELIAWDRATLDDYYTPQHIAGLRQLIKDEGLVLSEFVTTPNGAASSDASQRAAAVEHFKRAVEVAHELGTSIINSVVSTPFDLPVPRLLDRPASQLVTLDLPAGLDWDRGYQQYVESVRAYCDACEAAGLRYALETHPYRWATTAIGLLRLYDQVNSPILGANFDPSHMFPCGDIPQVAVYQLGKRVFHTHFSDNDAETNAHWRPGKGKIDWAATLMALRDVGYDGVISIELEDVPGRASAQNPIADERFEHENQASCEYLAELAQQIDLDLSYSTPA